MLLDEYKNKWDKIFLVTPVFALVMFGYVLSDIAGNVFFVERIGADYLPYTYIAGAFGIAFLALLVSNLIARKNIVSILQIASLIGIIFFFGSLFLIKNEISWGYPLFLIFSQVFYILIAGTVVWNLGLKICSPFEAKRVFTFFSAGASLGGILGGVMSSFLGEYFSVENVISIIIGSLLLMTFILIFVKRRYSEMLAKNYDSNIENWKNGFRSYCQAPIAKLLLISLTIFYVVSWIGDYEFQKILGESLSEAEFSKISGLVSIFENIGLVLIFIFVQQRIFKSVGVLNTLFSTPFILIIPFIVLLFLPFPFVAGALLLVSNIINYSFFSNSVRLIFTVIPNGIRSSAMTFVGGNADSIAMLVAGISLALLNRFLTNTFVIVLAIVLLLTLVVVIFYMRSEYVKQIIINLDSSDKEDLHNAIENFAERGYKSVGVKELMKLIQWKTLDCETVRKIVFSLGKIDNVHVIPGLLELFERYDSSVKYAVVEAIHSFSKLNERLKDLSFTRLNIIEFYEKFFLEEENSELKVFILQNLKDFDPDQIIIFLQNAIASKNSAISYQALKAMKYFNDRGIVKYVKPFLDNQDLMMSASSLIALWQFSEMRPVLVQKFIKIMDENKNDAIKATLMIIGKLKFKWEVQYVKSHLIDNDEELSMLAALTLLDLEDEQGLSLIIPLLTQKKPFSVFVAKYLKEISSSMKKKVLEKIRKLDYVSVKICVENLKATYLNFNDEIEFLEKEKPVFTSLFKTF